MTLHTDVPTRAEVDRLLRSRNPASVSLYLATDRRSNPEGERIEMRNLAAEAVRELREGGVGKGEVDEIEEELSGLIEDEDFWARRARSLAVFVTPERNLSFRLPNRLSNEVVVADRFFVKPLMRSLTFPQTAYVLALSQNEARLIEVSADSEPAEVKLSEMPRDAASFAGKASLGDRSPAGRIQGSEGLKVRLGQYARGVDHALRPFLGGQEVPLILAATEPLEGIFRSVCSYPHLAEHVIQGSPEGISDGELSTKAREVLDEVYAKELADVRKRFEGRRAEGLGLTDIGDVARAATFGAVDTVLVDIDGVVPGTIDESTGAPTFTEDVGPDHYGVIDEIVRRVWMHSGRVLAVRAQDIPEGGPVAAILRYRI